MNNYFQFSSGVLLDTDAVEKISTVNNDPEGRTFYIWVWFVGHPQESYRYLLGASVDDAQAQYLNLLRKLSSQ